MDKIKLLLIEDNTADARLIDIFLEEVFPGKYSLTTAGRLIEGIELLRAVSFDAIICDLALPDSYGLETCTRVMEASPEVPVIVLTGHGDEEFGLNAVAHGAADFLNKNHINSQLLRRSITYSIERSNLQKQVIANHQAKEVAEQAARVRQEFLSVMSHEIRTPLNAIIGTTQLLLEEKPSPVQREHLNALQFSAHNLLALINNILDFSKIDSGKILLEKINFNLHNLINGIVDSFRHTAIEKNLRLIVDIEKKLPVILIGDPTRLTQILNNLLHNALKFTKKGQVRLHIEALSKMPGEVELLFEVSDTGIGIEENRVHEIFESFTQARPSITRQFGGTGLGLTICKKLVTVMGGDIRVESEVGKGSSFFFNLTFGMDRDGRMDQNDTTRGRDFKLDGTKILLVEDNPTNRMLTEKFLIRWGAAVETADNGMVAVEKVKSKIQKTGIKNEETAVLDSDVLTHDSLYHLVLMDLQMPVMDGFEANKKIREMGISHDDMRVIALSAYAMDEDRQRVFDSGMDDFIAKPIDLKELYTKIVRNIPKKSSEIDTTLNQQPDGVLDLMALLGTFEDDSFRLKYLDSLQKEFIELPAKLNDALEKSDMNLLEMHIHKISASFLRLEEKKLPELLKQLKQSTSMEQNSDGACGALLSEIKKRCSVVSEHIAEIKKQFSN